MSDYCRLCGSPIKQPRVWSWALGTPRERADMVRGHHGSLSLDQICEVFGLTMEGAAAIINGKPWAQEHHAPPQ